MPNNNTASLPTAEVEVPLAPDTIVCYHGTHVDQWGVYKVVAVRDSGERGTTYHLHPVGPDARNRAPLGYASRYSITVLPIQAP